MSPCYGTGKLAICTGTNIRFQARTHWRGYQKWNLIGKPSRSKRAAARRMLEAFLDNPGGWVNRADVIMTADYYDPVQLFEMRR